ncbi:MAG: glutamyl-tRNA reductase [Sulfurovum sp.]|nr:glutamyl-tRNA reductase [Sulfurovum sp.]
MYYQVISFSHKNCDQEMREQLAFTDDSQKLEFLNLLTGFEFVHEAFIISTCNRVEIVLATRDNFSSYHAILGLMAGKSKLNFYALKSTAKRYDDEDAVAHIFAVVSSLESLVIGESQITGQVKESFMLSRSNATAGAKLNRMLVYALKCAAEVRNVTRISQKPISIASVAVAQANSLLGENMAGMTAIVIGAGEMGVLATKHLLRAGCDVVLLGRDREKLDAIVQTLGENVKADTMDTLVKYLNRYRLVFTATSAIEPIIERSMIENTAMQRYWFDMAIPKDIEEMNIPKLQLFRIDDLRSISQTNHALREEQAVRAEEIVQEYKEAFYAWLRALSVEPLIKQMRLQVEEAIDVEMKRAIRKGFVPLESEENMRKMAVQMFKRFLHDPTQNLRQSSTDKENANCIESVKGIFNIDTENIDVKVYKDDHHTKGYNG